MRKSYNNSRPWLSAVLSAAAFKLVEANNNATQEFPLDSHGHRGNSSDGSNESSAAKVECVPPSINEFPPDFFDDEQRLWGGFLVHALIVAYMCVMMAIVCDKYFVPSLRIISDYFNVPADIAGATFMAIGTSSPELFSSVIGAFVAKGDIGIGTVVGSAVFNMLAVTGASGLAIGVFAVKLDWYPITRDCFFYMFTVASLVIVIHDNVVTMVESICLLSMFACYVVILCCNKQMQPAITKMVKSVGTWCTRKHEEDVEKMATMEESSPLVLSGASPSIYYTYDDSPCLSSCSSSASIVTDNSESSTVSQVIVKNPCTKGRADSLAANSKLYAFEASQEFLLFEPPSESALQKIFWIVTWPANLILCCTIPNCTSKKNLKWFPLTFTASVVWLGILSYISFWMVAIIGYTFGIPDTVSGLTILAAGTSVPEMVASIIVVKSGLPNMAISNLISSNIFDILFCLGLPWLVKALLNPETQSVVINSSALTYTTLILLATVVLFYSSLVANRWQFGCRVGVVALCLYASFLVLASLYESNVFGDFNPPTCLPS